MMRPVLLFIFRAFFLLSAFMVVFTPTGRGQSLAEFPDSIRNSPVKDSAYVVKLFLFFQQEAFAKPDLARAAVEEALVASRSLGNQGLEAQALYKLAVAYSLGNQYEVSLSWLDSAAVAFEEARMEGGLQMINIMRGVNFDHMGHLERALTSYRMALAYYRDEENKLEIARVANNIGNIYQQQDNFPMALEHFQEAFRSASEVGEIRLTNMAATNLGNTYASMDSLAQADRFLMQVYSYNKANDVVYIQASVCALLGGLRLEQGRLPDGKAVLDEGLRIARKVNDHDARVRLFLAYGKYFRLKGLLSDAISSMDSARAISWRIKAVDHYLRAQDGLYLLHKQRGEFGPALRAYEASNAVRDSLFGVQKSRQLEELSALHKLERRQEEIDRLKTEGALQAQVLAQKDQLVGQQNWVIGGVAAALVLSLVLLVFVALSERRRRAANRILQARNEQIARQQEEILSQNSALATKNIHLENANAEIEGLIAIVAHDLKSPLDKTRGIIELMKLSDPPAAFGGYFDMINKVLDGGKRLIQDVLTVKSLDNEGDAVALKDTDVGALMEEISGTFDGAASKKSIRVDFVAPDGPVVLPSSAESIERIMENLISNAIKFSPAGKVVTVSVEPVGDAVVLAVQDQGPGISEADQGKMFKKFQKLSAKPTGGESSTGLGLSIVKGLVERIGGEIRVVSSLGAGARFEVVLPVGVLV